VAEINTEDDIDTMIEQAKIWYKENWWTTSQNFSFCEEELQKHVEAQSLAELKLDEGLPSSEYQVDQSTPGPQYKMGYVYKCLGSAILLLRQAVRAVIQEDTRPLATQVHLFEKLVTALVMEGGDADTNAAAAGALLVLAWNLGTRL
jgi:ADP-ribosylglycohydrolase